MAVEKIDKILKRTIANLDLERKFKEGKIMESWKDIVGKQIARHTQPLGIKRKKLFIQVDNSTWVYQLTMHHKEEILNKLNQEIEEPLIKDIHFKLGKVGKEEIS